jgi:hypothetical protein
MGYNGHSVLRAEYVFRTLKIKLYDEDFQHALGNHPGEVSLDKIKSCIETPDKVIQSLRGKNACLFYQIKMADYFFVVVVHVTSAGAGEIKTAYESTYVKTGKVLYSKERE